MNGTKATLQANADLGRELGEEGLEGVSKAFNLAQGAFMLLFTLVILAVAALVGGEFIDAVPYETDADGNAETSWGEAIVAMEDNAGTAFLLFAVGLLVIPAAALIAYLWSTLGGMMGSLNGGGGMRR